MHGDLPGFSINRDVKFDLQLSEALIKERGLGAIFLAAKIERIELKSETYQWERTGNICIEFRHKGRPSGVASTEADMWVHALWRDGRPLVFLMFPVDRLKELARAAIRERRWRSNAGDDGRSDVALVRIVDLLPFAPMR